MYKKIFILLSFIFLCLIGFIIYQWQSKPKMAHVLIHDLYNGFDMKKEMEKKYKAVVEARKKILDSLSFELKAIANQIQSEQEKNKTTIKNFEFKREIYFQKKQAFEEDNETLSKQYDQEILTQLNQYVKDYSLLNGYTYVFGNDENGSLMYGNENNNITREMIVFVNDKYKGL